ncbi:MAG: beta-ketoacyl-ACP synthase II [Alphaproteobacteria bacterium]|nr:MAG: beta-ketoacyl-[acyl-carrier-protein] synthase II [Alphaproteobacteria bacterium]|tara:strand:- start:446 stop:1708 length:1263 start_codon:yes stop_codon:yes gene_type:complete
MRRVVVTGLGLVTPLAGSVNKSWDKLINSESGINSIDGFDVDDLPAKIAGQVPNMEHEDGFDPNRCLELKEQRKVDRFILFAIDAADQAIKDSKWEINSEEDSFRSGVLIGSGIGGLSTIEQATLVLNEKGPRRLSPFFIPSCLINLASGQVSIKNNFKGPNLSVVSACSTGAHAIGDAARLIRANEADIMVAGGSEAAITRLGIGGFAAARALSTGYNDTPASASRPWDEGRDGFVMGEGAGCVVLEDYEHAKARGARIYAEILGYGLSADAYHITAPAENGDGGYRAMQAAIFNGGIDISEIDYINAHGTSTPLGDEIELGAVKRLFSDNMSRISVSSTKSSVGHMLGAAGAVEAIFSVLSVCNDLIPPTLNLENPCENAEGIDLVPLKAKEKRVNMALSNSFGFGGTNASLIVGKVK